MSTSPEEFFGELNQDAVSILNLISNLSSKEMIGIMDYQNLSTWWCDRARDFFKLSDNVIVQEASEVYEMIHPEDLDKFKEDLTNHMHGKNLEEPMEYRVLTGDSSYSLFTTKMDIVWDPDGKPKWIVMLTENHGISDEVDAVTGLYGEELFDQRVTELVNQEKKPAILKIAIDQFSHVNVMYGANYANQVLSEVAYILRLAAGKKGLVFRLSGAKFALVFENMSEEELERIYQFIQDSLSDHLAIQGKKAPLKVSGGGLVISHSQMDSIAIRSHLTYALNHSHHHHHGELVVYNDEQATDFDDNLELISRIHEDAVKNREGFYLCYQPIANTATGKIMGMEALLRWKGEPYGVVPPGYFIDWLEEDPCIFELGNWIIGTALADAAEISKTYPGFFVHVNIAAGQVERREFRESVMALLMKSGLAPSQFCMELTERVREMDMKFLRKEIEFFKGLGIKIAMDDFGTGNASLALALDLPVDELKIDMSFVQDIQRVPVKQAMVRAIVDFANNTGVETCIEGVEDQEVLEYLRQYQATWHQGYFYSRPVPIQEFKKLLEEENI
ncbi:MAG: GGDEF and EAL domain-containing protein [Eubacterium sp.]|nr:GGDEF and EAL domain-containing protein [Eubacterium sp.]